MSAAIVWFRQDLRCHDNPALSAACARHPLIIPLYIHNPESLGAAQHWWVHHSLQNLEQNLQAHNLHLCLQRGTPLSVLKKLIQQHQISAVYWNRCYEPQHIARDKEIKETLKKIGLEVHSFNGSLLNEPWTIHNKSGGYFKVFTPYWKHCIQQVAVPQIEPVGTLNRTPELPSEHLHDWHLLPQKPDWAAGFASYWQPGAHGAQHKLSYFIEKYLSNYKENRDIPAKNATSHLSPHLHFGEISPWEIWRAIQHVSMHADSDLPSTERFLTELGWREFSYYLLYHFPDLPDTNFRKEFNHFPWQHNPQHLQAWQKGMTGYPIVDAGMRELWHTGYMHNRVRMIVASFLIKDLGIDWREGAQWFYDTLLDADLANNSASWQWVAGTGADSAPYFRIFNPCLQGEKFDPQGEYVKKWVPELSNMPTQWIHKPWTAPKGRLPMALGSEYPLPIIDHDAARKQALEHYQAIKNRA